jgi:hypothetical protein
MPSVLRPASHALGAVLLALAAAQADAADPPQATRAALDAEWRASGVAARIGASSVWARGATGGGLAIGLVDTGVRGTHVDLGGRILTGYNAIDGGSDTGDAIGHGTHVAGLLAASRDGAGIVGVAPELRVLPVRVFAEGGASDAVLSAGVRWAAARVGILNLSLSAGGPIAGAALRDAVAGGALVVVAAGNRGAAHPDWPARFARERWANGAEVPGALIAVGAVDASDRIAAFSNRAGDAAAWYLVAPGVDLLSTYGGGDQAYARVSGTSMAAPAVSGAAALLRSQWPRLAARDIAAILLATARDLGAPGTDAVYGRGLLDVEAAMRPLGELQTQAAGGAVALSGTGLRLSPATTAIAQAAGRDGFTVVGLDAYRRDFPVELSGRILAPLPMRVDRAMDALDARLQRIERTLPGGSRLAWQAGESFALSGRDAAGEYAFAAGSPAREWFGVAAGLDIAALGNPYAALGPRGALLARGVEIGDTRLKAGLMGGEATESSGSGWGQVDAQTLIVEASRRVSDGLTLSATATRSSEAGSWLGAVGTGGFAPAATARTDALQLGAAWTVAPGAVVAATWSQGRTPAQATAGLLGTIGQTRSDAMSVALAGRDVLRPGDGLTLSVSQPMRARSGEAVATVQTGVDAAGDPITAVRTIALAPDGRDLAAEVAWRARLGRDASLGLSLAVRRQPNHDASADPDALLALRYLRAF